MAVDKDTVRRIARLARMKLEEDRVEPMTSAVAHSLKMRDDVVTEPNNADALMVNAPGGEDHFFVVPKVVE